MAGSIKSELKKARACLDSQNYEDALKCCKNVLKWGGSNYLAYIIQGKAFLQTDRPEESLQALKSAQGLEPNHLTTFQALINYHENYPGPDSPDVLIELYSKLLQAVEFGDKKIETALKLAKIYENKELYSKIKELIESLASQTSDSQALVRLWSFLLRMLLPKPSKTDFMMEMMENGLKCLTSLAKNSCIIPEELPNFFKEYILLLLQTRRLPQALEHAREFYFLFSEVEECLELLLRVQVELYLEQQDEIPEDLETNIELLKDTDSPYVSLASAILAFSQEYFEAAASHFNKGLQNVQGMQRGWVLLARSLLHCAKIADAEGAADTAKQHTKFMNNGPLKQQVLGDLLLCKASIAATRRSWKLCYDHLEKALRYVGHTPQVLAQIAQIYLLNDKIAEVEKILLLLDPESSLHSRLAGEVYLRQGKLDQAKEVLSQLPPTDARGQHLLGELYFQTGPKHKAVEHLLQAIKLNAFCARSFFFLSRIYRERGSITHALTLMDRALSLDPNDEEIGLSISDMLQGNGDKDKCLEYLQYIAKVATSENCHWVYKRLAGLLYDMSDMEEAYKFIQKALQLNPTNSHCWELLGDIYIKREIYKSATKAFIKAIELDESNSLYPSYRIGYIHQLEKELDNAIAIYEELLAKDPSYLPVLTGLAECLIDKVKKLLADGSSMKAKETIERCFTVINMLMAKNPSQFHGWHLYGKLAILGFQLDVPWFPLDLGTQGTVESPAELLLLAERGYLHALELEPKLASLWCSLGLCYYLQSRISGDSSTLLKKSLACAKCAVAAPDADPTCWSLLGIVACHPEVGELALAQHALIQAVEMDQHTAIHWCNLAVFYLEHKRYPLAQKVIQVAECEEPELVEVWILKGLLAELNGSGLVALDCYFHAVELANHSQAHLGFVYYLLQLLPQLDSSYLTCQRFLHQGEAALIKYTGSHSGDIPAWTMLSLIQERLANYRAALSSISRACQLSAEESDVNQQETTTVNLSRILWQNGCHQEALEVWSHLPHLTDPQFLCFQALLEHHCGDLAAANDLYIKAINESPDDLVGHIFTALAFVLLKTSNRLGAIQSLLVSVDSISPKGLLALYGAAILEKEEELAGDLRSKLLEAEKDSQMALALANFMAYDYILLREQLLGCQEHVAEFCQAHPGDRPAAIMAAGHMLQLQKWGEALPFLTQALELSDSTADRAPLALGQLLAGDLSGAMVSAHTAVLANPEDYQSWLTLLAAMIPSVLTGKRSLDVIYRLFDTCFHLVPKDKNPEVCLWLHLTRLWLTLVLGHTNQLPHFFGQVEDNELVKLLKSYQEGELPLVPQLLFTWLVKCSNDHTTLQEAINFAQETKQVHWLPLLHSHQVLQQLRDLTSNNQLGDGGEELLLSLISQFPHSKLKTLLLIRFYLHKKDSVKLGRALESLVFFKPSSCPIEQAARTALYHIYKTNNDQANLKKLQELCQNLGCDLPTENETKDLNKNTESCK